MKITGTGCALPERTITNDFLAGFLDTSDEWIKTRTGISERRVITNERPEELAALAASNALESAGMRAEALDFILCATTSGPYKTPPMSCIIQGKIGANCPCMDINCACVGFIAALQTAQALLATGCKNILIVCAEENSRLVDWADRSTCVLFGDAFAAAVVSGGGEDAVFIINAHSNLNALSAESAPGNSPFTSYGEKSFLKMDGQEVYKFAVSSALSGMEAALSQSGLAPEDISYFLLHQANLRIIESIKAKFGAPAYKFPTNVEKYGNTSSASIPLLLDELNRRGGLYPGGRLVLCAFGAGLLSGVCLLKW